MPVYVNKGILMRFNAKLKKGESMAKVVVKILGENNLREAEASTIGELKSQLGLGTHAASINGEPADNDSFLSDDSLVTFSQAVKGGNR